MSVGASIRLNQNARPKNSAVERADKKVSDYAHQKQLDRVDYGLC